MAADSPKPICAIVDTCVWRAEPLLKTPLGVTLVYYLSRRGGVIGLPEVVELELKGHIIDAGLEAAKKISAPLHLLCTLTDDPSIGMEIVNEELLRMKVEERIAQLDSILYREPFTNEHAKAALAMVNAKLPPSDKDQQFKDCAIWQAVLSISRRYSTVLITNDKSFFHNREPNNLANNLIEDCTKAGVEVKGFYGIAPFLTELEDEKPIFNDSIVREKVLPFAMQQVTIESKRHHMVPTEPFEFRISAFPTENPNRLAIDYSCTFNLECTLDMEKVSGIPNKGIVYGSAYFFPEENKLTDHYIQRIMLRGNVTKVSRDFKEYDDRYMIPRPIPWDWGKLSR
jgi:hypothetical protein